MVISLIITKEFYLKLNVLLVDFFFFDLQFLDWLATALQALLLKFGSFKYL